MNARAVINKNIILKTCTWKRKIQVILDMFTKLNQPELVARLNFFNTFNYKYIDHYSFFLNSALIQDGSRLARLSQLLISLFHSFILFSIRLKYFG